MLDITDKAWADVFALLVKEYGGIVALCVFAALEFVRRGSATGKWLARWVKARIERLEAETEAKRAEAKLSRLSWQRLDAELRSTGSNPTLPEPRGRVQRPGPGEGDDEEIEGSAT